MAKNKDLEIKTSLTERNLKVLEAMELGFTYKQTALLLDLTCDQVSESVKVLHDVGMLEYRKKKNSILIDKYIPIVRDLMKTSKSRREICRILKISDQTIVRCISRINAEK